MPVVAQHFRHHPTNTMHASAEPAPTARLERHDADSDDRPKVPRSADEWESKKPIIRELYITQNIRVQDVAEIMASVYKFKATSVIPPSQFSSYRPPHDIHYTPLSALSMSTSEFRG